MAFLFDRAMSGGQLPGPGPAPPPPASPPLDLLIQHALSSYLSGNGSSNDAATAGGKVAEKGTLCAVANSLRRCVSGMSRWDMNDLTLGLYKIATRHALEGTSDTITGSEVLQMQELEELLYWLDWAWASYLADEKAIIDFLKIDKQQLKKHVKTSAILKPAYCIAVDDAKCYVILSIRGTYAATDVLTDLQPHSEQFEGGHAHSGMLSAARWILDNEADNLQMLLTENPGYKLVVAGHSLGAGAGSLLCFLLRESVGSGNERVSTKLGVPSSMVQCWGYGCPPCVDRQLAEQATFIRNVVLQDDIIARASISALEDLRSEILQTDWDHVLEDGGVAKKMMGLVNSTQSTLGNVEQALGCERGSFYQQAKSLSYAAMMNSFRGGMYRGQQGMHGPPHHYSMHGPPGYYGMPGPPGQHGPPRILSGLLSLGATAIGSYFGTPGNRDQAQIASVSLETNDSTTSASIAIMKIERLFVPGILYHVTRKPIEERDDSSSLVKENLSDLVIEADRLSLVETASDGVVEKSKLPEHEQKRKTEISKGPIAMKHGILKGSDPTSRFMKIVLSKSMLSDHSLVAYKEAMKDVIHQAEENI